MRQSMNWEHVASTVARTLDERSHPIDTDAEATPYPGVCIAFGADDPEHDPAARMAISILRGSLPCAAARELAFAVHGRTWVMLVTAERADSLACAVEHSFQQATGQIVARSHGESRG